MSLTIVLPRPPQILNPNKRCHYHTKAKATAKARSAAYFHACSWWGGITPPRWELATVRKLWIMPTWAHHPDPTNTDQWLKATYDGLCNDWGVMIDDRGLKPIWGGIEVTKTFVDPRGDLWPKGCVVLTFEEWRPE